MFSLGVDALWLDATEPEGFPHDNATCALGSADQLFNSYSLMTTTAIADGLREHYAAAQGRRPSRKTACDLCLCSTAHY